jgi:hypothetical protein
MPASSPAGGNFVSADGAFDVQPISQMISGLSATATYTLSFWFAGAQQYGYTGATTEQWEVLFGSEAPQYTQVLPNLSEGFTGWQWETLTVTADSMSDLLSFIAIGTPNGVPPFVLLSDVSLVETPEPETFTLVTGTLIACLGALRMKKWFQGRSRSERDRSPTDT